VTRQPKSVPGEILPTFTQIVARQTSQQAIIENGQQADVRPLAQAHSHKALMDEIGWTAPNLPPASATPSTGSPSEATRGHQRRVPGLAPVPPHPVCVIDDDQRQSKDAFLAEKLGHFRRISPPRGTALWEYIMQNPRENRMASAAPYLPPEFAPFCASPRRSPGRGERWG
jgi:hypothetical protein